MAALLGCLGLLLFHQHAHALAFEQVGPDKPDRPTVEQPGWHKGIVELPRHGSRVYSIEVNGNENFYFQTSPDELNELIARFSKARLRDHEVWFEPGTNWVKSFSGTVIDYNVSLRVLYGIALSFNREKGTTETFEPRLTIYVGENLALLKQLKLPGNIRVHSEVPGADFPGHAAVPSRKTCYGRLQFDDGKPAVDFENSLQTMITLWDKDSSEGIPLGHLTSDAILRAAFSDGEFADLKSGKSWLTVSVGNFLTQPKRTDAKFPPELLAEDKDQTKPFQISRPSGSYFGRLLFEDGAPAVLTNKPGGQEIFVDFPYAGMGRPDAEGYFKVHFTPEQFAQLGKRKPSKNIYVPVDEHSGRATDIFPPELLSQEKAKAGVVKIARPVFAPRYDPAKAPSLIGKPLPALGEFRMNPSPGALSGQMVVVCFLDLQQRPSRHWITELLPQTAAVKAQGAAVLGVQASAVGRDVLQSLVASNRVTFALGSIGAEEAKTLFDWGVKSLPWLILADKEHIVRAEGFAPGELADKLGAIHGDTPNRR